MTSSVPRRHPALCWDDVCKTLPPCPVRGDYFEQVEPYLPLYALPPSACDPQRGPQEISYGLKIGTVFGPVHAVVRTPGLVSVAVPVPFSSGLWDPSDENYDEKLPDVVWMNIWVANEGHEYIGLHYCRKVPAEVVESWKRMGWRDWYFRMAVSASSRPSAG